MGVGDTSRGEYRKYVNKRSEEIMAIHLTLTTQQKSGCTYQLSFLQSFDRQAKYINIAEGHVLTCQRSHTYNGTHVIEILVIFTPEIYMYQGGFKLINLNPP